MKFLAMFGLTLFMVGASAAKHFFGVDPVILLLAICIYYLLVIIQKLDLMAKSIIIRGVGK